MQWKYSLPDPWTDAKARVALEDVYLTPADERAGVQPCWFTLEGLRSFTGGTLDEKLERLGGAEFIIDELLDMLIHREDFDKEELLEWTRVFIREHFGDSHPVLLEATATERSQPPPPDHTLMEREHRAGKMRVLFVCPSAGTRLPISEDASKRNPAIEVRMLYTSDGPFNAVDEELVAWADTLIVPEARMRQMLRRRFKTTGTTKRVVSFPLPTDSDVLDSDSTTLLRERIDAYLDKLALERNL